MPPTDDIAMLAASLRDDRTVDIVTTGRRSGRPRTTEIWTTIVDGQVHLAGTPGAVGSAHEPVRTRDWLHNLRADPRLTVRLKTTVVVELAFTAVEITDPYLRRTVYASPAAAWYRDRSDLDTLVRHAPLVRLDPADDLTHQVITAL